MNALIMGRRFQGKTTLALHLAHKHGGGIAIFDPRRMIRAWPESSTSNFRRFREMIESADHPLVVYQPVVDTEAEFSEFGEYLWTRTGLVIFVDEAALIQKAGKPNLILDRYVRTADQDVWLIQTLHRPSDAAVTCRALASDWYIFRTHQENDLEAIVDRCGQEVADLARNLPQHHLIHWNDETATFELWQKPMEWYTDFSRPLREGESCRTGWSGLAPAGPSAQRIAVSPAVQ